MKSQINEVLNLNNIKLSRNLKLIFGAFILLLTLQSNAQVSVSLNIGTRPDWCGHYEDNVEYFYLPEIEAYYDVHSSVFIYLGPRGWIRSAYLPEYCHGYDLHRGYKVAIDYHGHSPYAYHKHHRTKYFRSNYRNYRQEYYNPGYNRRTAYVAAPRHRDHNRDHRNNHNNHNRNDRGRDTDSRDRGNDRGHGNNNGNGNDRGNGHGRR
jgi:hypothetical protein